MSGSLTVVVSKNSCFPSYTVQILGASTGIVIDTSNAIITKNTITASDVLVAQTISRGETKKFNFPNMSKAIVRVLASGMLYSEDVFENPMTVNSEIKLGECPPCKTDGDCKTWAPHCLAGRCSPPFGAKCVESSDCPENQKCGNDGKCMAVKPSPLSKFLKILGYILLLIVVVALGVYLYKKFLAPHRKPAVTLSASTTPQPLNPLNPPFRKEGKEIKE